MIKLQKSESLGRVIRQDDLDSLGISTWTAIKDAIKAGNNQLAVDLVDYLKIEGKRGHNIICDFVWVMLTYIADNLGEEAVYQAWRNMAGPHYQKLSQITPLEMVWVRAESERGLRSGANESGNVEVVEEADRYIIYLDPCGTGGRMRREGRTKPPYNYGVTKKAYPWSWGKVGVPYYCLHCCIMSEILPIEWHGVPQRITGYSDNPDDPCAFYIYKSPELIPEEFFTRVGKKKDLARIGKITPQP